MFEQSTSQIHVLCFGPGHSAALAAGARLVQCYVTLLKMGVWLWSHGTRPGNGFPTAVTIVSLYPFDSSGLKEMICWWYIMNQPNHYTGTPNAHINIALCTHPPSTITPHKFPQLLKLGTTRSSFQMYDF